MRGIQNGGEMVDSDNIRRLDTIKCVGGKLVPVEPKTEAPETQAPETRTIQRVSAPVGGRVAASGGRTAAVGSRTGNTRAAARPRGSRELQDVECVEDVVWIRNPAPVPVAETTDTLMTRSSAPGTKGDPHFKTHGGEMYDFHGGCDLVLLDNPDFMDGLGMRIHIRTKIETWWSYVESSVIQIGDESVEINGGGKDQWLYINGVANEPLEDLEWYTAKVGGLNLRYKRNGGNGEAHLYFGNSKSEKLVMRTYNDFVKVEVAAHGSDYYLGSQGLLGRFPDGKRVGRDGETFIEDVNTFGQEWQVSPTEPQLFHTYEGEWIVPAGQKCVMPEMTETKRQLRQRRLANGIPMQEAERACAHLESTDDRKACVFDVVSTQDVNMVSVW